MKKRGPWYVVRKKALVLAILITTYHVPHTTLYAADGYLAQQAELAWQDRDKPGQTEMAIQLWELAVKAEPGRGDLWIHLTKALGRAVRHSKTPQERQHWADRAKETAAKAIEKSPASAEAYTAQGEALGQWADAHKGIHSLKAVREAVEALQKAITIDPKQAAAHMLLAEFYRQSPKFLSIGDKAKALEEAKLAVQYGPDYAINHLVLAKAYLDLSKKDQGIAELQHVVGMTPPTDAVPETHADQETAMSLLRDMGITPDSKSTGPLPPPGTPQCGDTGGSCTDQPH